MEFSDFQNISKDFKFFNMNEEFLHSKVVLGDLLFFLITFIIFELLILGIMLSVIPNTKHTFDVNLKLETDKGIVQIKKNRVKKINYDSDLESDSDTDDDERCEVRVPFKNTNETNEEEDHRDNNDEEDDESYEEEDDESYEEEEDEDDESYEEDEDEDDESYEEDEDEDDESYEEEEEEEEEESMEEKEEIEEKEKKVTKNFYYLKKSN
jgi:hypothetical protein